MSDVAAYNVFVCVCALFTGAGRYVDSTYLPAPVNKAHTNTWYAATSLIIMEDS